MNHKQYESHPCIHLQISSGATTQGAPALAGGRQVPDWCQTSEAAAAAVPLENLCLSTGVSPPMPARSSQDTGTRTAPDNPRLTSQTDPPGRSGPEVTSNFFFIKEKLLQETGESRIQRNIP